MSSPTSSAKNGTNPNRRAARTLRRLGAVVAAAIVGGAVGLAVLMFVTAARNQDRLPRFEIAEFEAAQQKWAAANISSYRLKVEVTGRQAAEYVVEVHNGEVQSALRDGQPLRQRRTFATWSVPGMFNTIRSDVISLERHRDGTADRGTPQVLLRGQFHPQLGYPLRYHRTELQKWGTNSEVSWQVVEFQ